ncbi:hypothetical protein CPT_Merlin151 [Citrobacter phage Merlin]|uniref:Uncharacterized protein n=1 Tax=Citrobacter phage Merlin TaxID=1675602 RepID=A0A0K1LMN4_9CAUD|nr:hypothetical protein CPT_Merlin151 [Citrobacter phage Merlin]AKU43797.1 hypothetical protein CPT_Merlin151 [Citrobacter phage Merlin]
MAKFNTVTIVEITDNFGEFDRFRAVLNRGEHEYHVTAIVESKKMASIVEYVNSHWPTAEVIFGEKI